MHLWSYSTFHSLQHQFIGFVVISRHWLQGFGQSTGNGKWNYWYFKLPEESVIWWDDSTWPSTLICYYCLGRVSMTQPVVFHRRVLRHIQTFSLFRSGHRVCAVWLYHSIRQALHQDRFISRFWAVAIHFACGLYSVGWDGMKSHSQQWSSTCVGDSPMFWMGMFLYWRITLAT